MSTVKNQGKKEKNNLHNCRSIVCLGLLSTIFQKNASTVFTDCINSWSGVISVDFEDKLVVDNTFSIDAVS